MAVTRPGPDRIAAGQAPGGLVIHVYDTTGRQLVGQDVLPDVDVALVAERNAAAALTRAAAGAALVLVIYDGDTGDRVLPPGMAAGDRL